MHWEGLFADLEAQADALEVAERAGEVTERARIETARLRLLDRLRAGVGLSLGLSCLGAVELRGQLRRVGPDWVLIDEGGGREAVIVAGRRHPGIRTRAAGRRSRLRRRRGIPSRAAVRVADARAGSRGGAPASHRCDRARRHAGPDRRRLRRTRRPSTGRGPAPIAGARSGGRAAVGRRRSAARLKRRQSAPPPPSDSTNGWSATNCRVWSYILPM